LYCAAKIEERLAAAERMLGWRPERHTIEAVDTANRVLEELYDPEEGRITRPLHKTEVRWIRNERALCACDYSYWESRYAYIKNWQNQIVRFERNVAQCIFHEVCAEMEEQGREILVQALKARQLGITTASELKLAHRVQFLAGVNAVVGSSDPDKSFVMSQIMELCWEMQPWWMMPERTKYKAGVLIEFGKQNSGVSIQHGTQMSGIARGATPTCVHLSELCDFSNPEELVDASLLRAMHPSPSIFGVFESTAQGMHNWWHRTWLLNKAHWADGKARMRPMFLPWYVGSDLYPTKTWIHTHPIPKGWEPAVVTRNHAERANHYVRSNPLLRKHLGEQWELSREQMWWWEVTREEYRAKGELAQFYMELPADDIECFQSTNISVFDSDLVAEYREAASRQPVEVFGIRGDDIPARLEPDGREIDRTKQPISVDYYSDMGVHKHWEFVPLKFEGYSATDPMGKLFIWEHPRRGEEYGIGVDTGEGIGLDQSVCEVLRKGTVSANDAQVAEFCSSYINSHDLWPVCLALAKYYSAPSVAGEERTPLVVIECMGNGETVQHEMRKVGWSNFFPWVRYDSRRINKSRSRKMGVVMVPWFRAMVMDAVVKYLRDGWSDINSPWFVQEMQDLERDEEAAKMKAMYGGHEDRIIAFGIVLFGLHDMEIRGAAPNVAQQRAESRHDDGIYPVYKPNLDQMGDTAVED
jgi:hypothetical protein